jgi:hypothetical protein
MISERNRGLFALSIVVQLILSQGLFWLYYLGFSTLYSDVTLFESSYAVYSLVALGGLIVEAMSRRDQDCDWTDKSILEKVTRPFAKRFSQQARWYSSRWQPRIA